MKIVCVCSSLWMWIFKKAFETSWNLIIKIFWHFTNGKLFKILKSFLMDWEGREKNEEKYLLKLLKRKSFDSLSFKKKLILNRFSTFPQYM